jgi:hypothetical protein
MSVITNYNSEALKAIGIRCEQNLQHKRQQWSILVQNTSAKKEEIYHHLDSLLIYDYFIAEEKILDNQETCHHHIYIADGDQSQSEIIDYIKKIYGSYCSDVSVFVIIKLVKYIAFLDTIDNNVMSNTISSVRELSLFDEAMDAINAAVEKYSDDKRKQRENRDKEDNVIDFSNLFL